MDIAPYITAKNSLARTTKKQKLLTQIVNKLEEVSTNQVKKQDLEFILLVTNIVENVISKKDKINKKEFVIDIFQMLYNGELTEEDKKMISHHIEYLWENEKIKKVDIFSKTFAIIGHWFERKIFR